MTVISRINVSFNYGDYNPENKTQAGFVQMKSVVDPKVAPQEYKSFIDDLDQYGSPWLAPSDFVTKQLAPSVM